MNLAYIAECGKFSAFDVSDEPPYDMLIGTRVDAFEPMLGPDGYPVGVIVRAGNHQLRELWGPTSCSSTCTDRARRAPR